MPILAIGGSIVGGIISAIGGNKAANAQEQAANSAANYAKSNYGQAIEDQQQATKQEQANLAPYQQAGTTALSNLSQMNFSAPTGVTEQNDPGYQFRLQQGEKALQNSAAARGGLLSGGTAKAINNYVQGQASSEYGNVYNRALQSYQTNLGTQFGLAGIGQNASNTISGLEQAGAQNQGNLLAGETGAVNQQTNNAAAARASGYASTYGQIGNTIAGAGNQIGNTIQLNQLLNAQQQPDQITGSGSNTWYGYGQPGAPSGPQQSGYTPPQ